MNPCYFDVRYDAFSNPMGAYSFVEFVEFVEVISILYFHSKRWKDYILRGGLLPVSSFKETKGLHDVRAGGCFVSYLPFLIPFICRVCRSYFYFILSFKETERFHSHRVVFCISSFLSHSINL